MGGFALCMREPEEDPELSGAFKGRLATELVEGTLDLLFLRFLADSSVAIDSVTEGARSV